MELGKFVTSEAQFVLCASECVRGASKFALTLVGNLGEFGSTFLQLEEIKVGCLDALVSLGVLTLLVCAHIAETVDFELIACTLFLKLVEFAAGCFVVPTQLVSVVILCLNISLNGKSFGFTTGDLLTESSDIALKVVVASILVIEVVPRVVDILLESIESTNVGVVSGLEVVVLKELIVLEVAELGLHGVELVAQSHVVFISLLDLENLCFQLRDEQVFLVRSQMDGVVVT